MVTHLLDFQCPDRNPERLIDLSGRTAFMTDRELTNVDKSLAEAVRNYLLQKQNDRISEDENLRPVCNWLARLLQGQLETADEWNPYNWVDDIIPCTAERVSPHTLLFTGLVIWGTRGTSKEWKDPLSATIELSETSPFPLRYELLFGRADRGLGTCPYGSPQDFPYVPVTDWMFTFTAPHSTEKQAMEMPGYGKHGKP
jgi:hypothetical protein